MLCCEGGFTPEEFLNRKPIQKNIDLINGFFDKGCFVVVYSARREEDRFLTDAWLKTNRVKYHALVLEKMNYDVYIEEKSKLLGVGSGVVKKDETGECFTEGRDIEVEGYIRSAVEWCLHNMNHAPEDKLVLDLGCNYGHALKVFAEHGWDGLGWDLFPNFIHSELRLEKHAMEDISFFNFAREPSLFFLNHSLEHSTRPWEVVAEIGNRTKSGGGVFIAVPDVDSDVYLQEDHKAIYTKDFLIKMLSDVGFQSIVVERVVLHETNPELFAMGVKN